jgi:hypothetical protein
MTTDPTYSILLEAGITGAGLVLAIYALVVQFSGRIFQQKREDVQKALTDLESTAESIRKAPNSEERKKYVNQLETIRGNMERGTTFPNYLSYGAAGSFFLYIMSALICLLSPSDYALARGPLIAATIVFLFAGLTAMLDIYRALKRDFENFTQLKSDIAKRLSEHAWTIQVGLPVERWGQKPEVPMAVTSDTTIGELINNAAREHVLPADRIYYVVMKSGVLGPERYAGTIEASGIRNGDRVFITDNPRLRPGPGAFTP